MATLNKRQGEDLGSGVCSAGQSEMSKKYRSSVSESVVPMDLWPSKEIFSSKSEAGECSLVPSLPNVMWVVSPCSGVAMTHIDSLSEDLLLLVFEYLEASSPILRLVCKRWNRIISDRKGRGRVIQRSLFSSCDRLIPWALRDFKQFRHQLLNVMTASASKQVIEAVLQKEGDGVISEPLLVNSLANNTEEVAKLLFQKVYLTKAKAGCAPKEVFQDVEAVVAATVTGSQTWMLDVVGAGSSMQEWVMLMKAIGNQIPRKGDHEPLKWALNSFLSEEKFSIFIANGPAAGFSRILFDPLLQPLCRLGRLSEIELVYGSPKFPSCFQQLKTADPPQYARYLKESVVEQLKCAAHGGHLDVIEWLHTNLRIKPAEEVGNYIMEEAVHLPDKDEDPGDNILHEHIIRWLFQRYPFRGIFDEFLFARAVRCCKPEFLAWLLDTVECTVDGENVIPIAIFYGRLDALQFLVNREFDVSPSDLVEALKCNADPEIIKFLVVDCRLVPTEEQWRQIVSMCGLQCYDEMRRKHQAVHSCT